MKVLVNSAGVQIVAHVTGEGTPVLLLHGFPDSAALWCHLTPKLNAAGYKTIAIDLRGFGESDAPAKVPSYDLRRAAQDALAVLDALAIQRAHLVGHDWGAALGWLLAGSRPDRFSSFSALSLGHARAYSKGGLRQFTKGWYMLPLLVPLLGEGTVRAANWYLLRRANPSESERWVRNLSRPGRLTAALNWYRANALHPPEHPNVNIPVLGIWSARDLALTENQMLESAKFVDGPWRYERIEGAGHWLPLDAAERIAPILLEHFESANRR
ncbi:MAG TPA: alpha/beta fold hydrolase [Polyangiaceae bacterium]|nr:alpha/beta fold hydrolase [Polyangiaceae bacterium]